MTDPNTIITLTVDEIHDGMRLDLFISKQQEELSRTQAQSLIKEGNITSDNQTITHANKRVKPGEVYIIHLPPPKPCHMEPIDIPLDIIFEDNHLLVINKQANLTVHPGAGTSNATLANALVYHFGKGLSSIGGVERPGIVHRLDKDTTGLILVAKTDFAHAQLSEQIANRSAKRCYQGIVWGLPSPMSDSIENYIGRLPHNRQKMGVLTSGGKHAITHYKVLEVFSSHNEPYASLIECRLQTGRTHQIRVHMTHKGHALIGDQTYGNQHRKLPKSLSDEIKEAIYHFPRQSLHAYHIAFEHPKTKEPMAFEQPLPEDMAELVGLLRG